MDNTQLRQEIRLLITFYELRGWCWLDAVAFTLYKHQTRPTRE